jgi:hypothetical protein
VTEPELPKIDGPMLRAFPGELPADEINTKIDESFRGRWREHIARPARKLLMRGARRKWLSCVALFFETCRRSSVQRPS